MGERLDVQFDVVVVGASFAGLSFASAAATHGLRVLVLERDSEVGGVVRTTGVLFSDVLSLMDVPQRFLLNAVRRIRIHAPGIPDAITVEGGGPRFFMADVTGMLRWMAESARAHGAEIRCGATFRSAKRDSTGMMQIAYLHRTDPPPGSPSDGPPGGPVPVHVPSEAEQTSAVAEQTVTAALLIGADGAQSQVARQTQLGVWAGSAHAGKSGRFLAGAEWIVAGVPVDRETFELIMDPVLAPGYCLWLAPHGELAALGVAGHQRSFKPNDALRQATDAFAAYTPMDQMRIVERKGGIIPVGGAVRQPYRDDSAAHALLLGDAAGLCGAATGGGIYPALLCGPLAAHAVANALLHHTPGAIQGYLRDLPRTGGLGPYLRVEDWLRVALDRLTTPSEVRAFYGLFATPSGNAILRRTLFETPIISMDSGFFAMIRGLLGQSPGLSLAAVQAIRQRLSRR